MGPVPVHEVGLNDLNWQLISYHESQAQEQQTVLLVLLYASVVPHHMQVLSINAR